MSKRNFYRFPEDMEITKEMVVEYHLPVYYQHTIPDEPEIYGKYAGKEVFSTDYPEDIEWWARAEANGVSDITICRDYEGNVRSIKKLMKKYGGVGFTEHYERDGGLFETTLIELKGDNTHFKYNHHL